MKVAILGIDGYLGWPLALRLLSKNYKVCGLDNYSRRVRVRNLRSRSLTPINSTSGRELYLTKMKNFHDFVANIDMTHGWKLELFLRFHKPDVIVHLAEQPSAPWSMINSESAAETQYDNVIGTLKLLWAMKKECPEAHLIKLGTMGEYGTPDCRIPEGRISMLCFHQRSESVFDDLICPMSSLLFPRTAGSWYHLSKVHDTHNIEFACRNWNFRSTDIMQGPVFGLNTHKDGGSVEPELLTRFDYDEHFGTVLNRFCVQAIIGHPLTVYGKGDQTRGYLTLDDSIQCMILAIKNPPKLGEYRTFNQFATTHTINDLANMVAEECSTPVAIDHIENPRLEAEEHYYQPEHEGLLKLGYKPTLDFNREINKLIETILPYKDRVIKDVIVPKTYWR